MQTSFFKTLLAAGICLFIISCNNSKKDKVKVTEIKLTDIKQEEEKIEPPPPPPPKEDPPKVEMKNAEKKCFTNDGLKYKTVITLYVGDNEVMGIVSSTEFVSEKEEKAGFTGTINGDKLTIKFQGTPPAAGAASEWTDKPWIMKKEGGKEILKIIFNAKDYDSNKWKNTEYQFAVTGCK